MYGKAVIPGAVIGTEDCDIGNVLLLGCKVLRIERRKEGIASLVFISPIGVNAILVNPIGTDHPVGIERVLYAATRMQRIRSFVTWVDERARAAVGRAGKAARIGWLDARRRSLIDGLECGHPAILRQIVVKHAEAGADDRVLVRS